METKKTLRDIYSFPGFRARATLKPHPNDPDGRIVTLERRQKKRSASAAAQHCQHTVTEGLTGSGTLMLELPGFIFASSTDGLNARTAKL